MDFERITTEIQEQLKGTGAEISIEEFLEENGIQEDPKKVFSEFTGRDSGSILYGGKQLKLKEILDFFANEVGGQKFTKM